VARDERGFIVAGPDVRARSIKRVASTVGGLHGGVADSPVPVEDRRTRCAIYSRVSREERPLLTRPSVTRVPRRWQVATISHLIEETARAKTIVLDLPRWAGHVAGHKIYIRLTAEDGYQADRSYAIASAPESTKVALTVERIDDGEVSFHLTGALRVADELELRGPIGGQFT
jgi:hypothetical protein